MSQRTGRGHWSTFRHSAIMSQRIMKSKTFLRFLKIVLVVTNVFLSLCIALILTNYFFHEKSLDELCYGFGDEVQQDHCLAVLEKCRPGNVQDNPYEWCVAQSFAYNELEFARKVCKSSGNVSTQKYCFAEILSMYDKNSSLAQCDLIREKDLMLECRIHILGAFNAFEALDVCESYDEEESRMHCTISILLDKMYNYERAQSYCEQILDKNLRDSCMGRIEDAVEKNEREYGTY